jgi:two-component system, cell cycle sensor histidine kinase and response regulator CckA
MGASNNRLLRVLHLEDNHLDLELVAGWFEDEQIPCEIINAQTAGEFDAALGSEIDIIISDFKLPSFDGLRALAMARQRRPEVPFILFSGTIGEESAVESLKSGATDYVLKQKPHRLIPAIRHALAAAEERKNHELAERKIREQAALLDKAQDAIIACDMAGRITFWNRGAERVYGWTPAEALGQAADSLLSGGKPGVLNPPASLQERGEWVGELNHVQRQGAPLVVESRWTLVRDSDDKPQAILIINTDVTERKKLEARFLRAQRMEGIGALAGGIAHDLNNVLAPILMAAELLGEEIEAADRKKMLVTVKACAQRGTEMVKQILSFARGAGGQAGPIHVKPIIIEMARLAKDTFPRSIRIKARVAPNLPLIIGNGTQLHQVLLNLCINARDAMPEGGDVEIAATPVILNSHLPQGVDGAVSGSYVMLSVSDTGQGMSPETADNIFEPFFTTKAEGKGTGLGLSTVIGIAKSHNGFVEVSSKLGAGSTFKVFLPAAEAAAMPKPEQKENSTPMGRGEQILVVDDELSFLEITRESLEACNYRVLMAHNGAEALATFQRRHQEIHAVITDMMMPIMDGPTAVQAMKHIDPFVKIIGVTGLGSESALAKAGAVQFQGILRKPYATAELLASLHDILNGGTS